MRARLSTMIAALAGSTTALGNSSIRRVILAFFAYNVVEIGAWTAILIYAFEATGPASIGVIAVIQLVPSALAAPVLAGVADRYRRERVLLGWYLVQGVAIGAIGLAILLALSPAAVYAVSTVATILLTQTRPVQSALLPDLAETPDELTASNALASIGEGVGAFVGPLGVGAIITVASIGASFLAGGLLLLAGGLLLLGVRARTAPARAAIAVGPGAPAGSEARDAAEPAAGEAVAEPRAGAVAGAASGADPVSDRRIGAVADADAEVVGPGSLLAGLRAVASDADLLVVMALLTGRLVIFGGLEVLVVLLAIDLLGIGDAGAGFLLAALGIGTIAGGSAAFALVGRRRVAPWLGVAAVIIGLPIALLASSPASSTAALLLAVSGVGLAVLDVAGQTLLQRITPDAVRARVFGVLEGLLLFGEAAGSILVGPLALLLGVPATAVLLGLLLPALAALAIVRFERIDGRVLVPTAQLDVLRRVPMFAALGPAAIESIARHLVPVAVDAGGTVIGEGEIGDRWYIVRDGRLCVSAGGRDLRVLGPGDTFGEIALLHDVPRTASVIADSAVELWALDREEFLAAVTRAPSAFAEAKRLADERVAASAVA